MKSESKNKTLENIIKEEFEKVLNEEVELNTYESYGEKVQGYKSLTETSTEGDKPIVYYVSNAPGPVVSYMVCAGILENDGITIDLGSEYEDDWFGNKEEALETCKKYAEGTLDEMMNMMEEKKTDDFKIGDLVWCPDMGQQGMIGMVVSDAKEGVIYPHSVTYSIYLKAYKGYNGNIMPLFPKEFVDLLDPKAGLNLAERRADIDTYTSIAAKRGITLNPKYQEALGTLKETMNMDEAKKTDGFKIGDLIWNKEVGHQGLVGLVVSDKKFDKDYGINFYRVYYRGYNGDILETSPEEMVDLLDGRMDLADEGTDISTYAVIAKKLGITLNPKYQEALDNPELDEMMGLSFSAENRAGRRNAFRNNDGHHSPQAPQNQNAIREALEKEKKSILDKFGVADLNEMMGVGFAPQRSIKRRQEFIGKHHSPQFPQSQAAEGAISEHPNSITPNESKEDLEKEKEMILKQLNEGAIMGDLEYKILDAYLEAALWTEEEEIGHASIIDINEDSKTEANNDVLYFMKKAGNLIDGIEPSQVGHDLWLTRNGHGAGFWDRGLGEVGDKLTEIAKSMGTAHLYKGDDGEIYFESEKKNIDEIMGVSYSVRNREDRRNKHSLKESLKKERAKILKQLNESFESFKDQDGDTVYKLPVKGREIEEFLDNALVDERLDSFLHSELSMGEGIETLDGNIFWASDIFDYLRAIKKEKSEYPRKGIAETDVVDENHGLSFTMQRKAGTRDRFRFGNRQHAPGNGAHNGVIKVPKNINESIEALKAEKAALLKMLNEGDSNTSTEPDAKDIQRVKDIITKSGGEENETALAKSRQMAKSITNIAKAKRRSKAARDLGYMQIAGIFSLKAKELEA